MLAYLQHGGSSKSRATLCGRAKSTAKKPLSIDWMWAPYGLDCRGFFAATKDASGVQVGYLFGSLEGGVGWLFGGSAGRSPCKDADQSCDP